MTRMIWLLIKLGLLVGLGIYFAHNPGLVRIEWLDWRIDTSAGILLLAIVVLAVIVAYWERLFSALRAAPGRFRERRKVSSREKGYRALTQGFVAVAAGDSEEAIRQSRLAERLLRDPPLTRLLAAQAAQLAGDDQAARKYFESMLEDPNGAFLGLRGLMVQATRAGNRAEALSLAERASALRPNTSWVMRELLELQCAEELWGAALLTLDRARRAKAMPRDEIDRRRATILTAQARQARREGTGRTALRLIEKARKADPQAEGAIILSAELHRAEGKQAKAEKLIEEAWRRQPSARLADAYRDIAPTDIDPLRQFKRFETLAATNPDDPESHLALGLMALNASLWGVARQHLDAVGDTDRNPRVCRLMARLEEEEHGDFEAAHRWLAKAASGVADDDEPIENEATDETPSEDETEQHPPTKLPANRDKQTAVVEPA